MWITGMYKNSYKLRYDLLFRFRTIEYKVEGLSFVSIYRDWEEKVVEVNSESAGSGSVMKAFRQLLMIRQFNPRFKQAGISLCRAIITNNTLVNALRDEHFDAVLIIDVFWTRCLHLIPQRLLQVPYASLGGIHDAVGHATPYSARTLHRTGSELAHTRRSTWRSRRIRYPKFS